MSVGAGGSAGGGAPVGTSVGSGSGAVVEVCPQTPQARTASTRHVTIKNNGISLFIFRLPECNISRRHGQRRRWRPGVSISPPVEDCTPCTSVPSNIAPSIVTVLRGVPILPCPLAGVGAVRVGCTHPHRPYTAVPSNIASLILTVLHGVPILPCPVAGVRVVRVGCTHPHRPCTAQSSKPLASAAEGSRASHSRPGSHQRSNGGTGDW